LEQLKRGALYPRPEGRGLTARWINNRRRITADTVLRLGLYFGDSPEFWLNLQTHCDLRMAWKSLKPEMIARIKAQQAA
jgi:antitoxin HigA-1